MLMIVLAVAIVAIILFVHKMPQVFSSNHTLYLANDSIIEVNLQELNNDINISQVTAKCHTTMTRSKKSLYHFWNQKLTGNNYL